MSRTPRSTPQDSPHPRTVSKPRTTLASSAALSENEPVASGSGVPLALPPPARAPDPGHSRQLPSSGRKENPPRSPQSLRASAPCPELSQSPPRRPCSPSGSPDAPGLAPPAAARGGGAEGWEEKGAEQAPPFPILRPQLSGKGCTQPPGRGRRHLPSSGVRTRLLTVHPVQLPVSLRRRCRPPLSSQPCSPGPRS